jgi:hypothetical protein
LIVFFEHPSEFMQERLMNPPHPLFRPPREAAKNFKEQKRSFFFPFIEQNLRRIENLMFVRLGLRFWFGNIESKKARNGGPYSPCPVTGRE